MSEQSRAFDAYLDSDGSLAAFAKTAGLDQIQRVETHVRRPTFTLYTNPDLVKALWEGSAE